MCGIVGYAGKTNVIKNIMTGLKSLEYRGYDSSGIAYLDKNNNIKIYKKVGQIKNLDQILNYEDEASLGISHTRWATHGGVTDTNAHPHNQGKITLVHNGIIENYEELKKELIQHPSLLQARTDGFLLLHLPVSAYIPCSYSHYQIPSAQSLSPADLPVQYHNG